jgi:3-dehydroquinate dehydratase II
MAKILLLQGANLTFLGRREPEIYGSTAPAELDAMLRCHAHDHAYELEIFYTNIEGEAINRIYQAVDEGFDGLVMNPAGFTYAGFALKDCIKGAGLPYVEVHISSIAKRNIHCVLSDVAEGMITGFGIHSYILGLDAMLEILKKRTNGTLICSFRALGRPEVDDQLVRHRRLHRQVGGLLALEDAVDINTALSHCIRDTRAVAHSSADFCR